MSKFIFGILLLSLMLKAEVYQVGDVVRDTTFFDTNLEGIEVANYERSFHGLIDQKKLLIINFFSPS